VTALAAPRPDDHAMRRAVIGSAVVHAAFTAAALFARARATIAVPGTESIEVALVDASTLGAPRPAAKAPEPAPALEERGVRIE